MLSICILTYFCYILATQKRREPKFGAFLLKDEISEIQVESYQIKKADLKEELEALENEVEALKSQRKVTNKHITLGELPESEKFKMLSHQGKHLIDTIKMIAYRAETSIVNTMREKMSRTDDARSLARDLFNTEVDLIPDEENKTLTVLLHHLATHANDRIIQHLCDEINSTEIVYPGTDLKLIYKMVTQ